MLDCGQAPYLRSVPMTSTLTTEPRPLVAGPTPADHYRAWRGVRWALLATAAVAYLTWFQVNGLIVDRLWVLAAAGIALAIAHVGRPLEQWVRLGGDLILFTVMWLAYEESRALADGLGAPLQVESVRDLDRLLLFGHDASLWMQEQFYSPETVHWYDAVASLLYATHYPLPAAIVVYLWVRNRHQWVRFMRRMATVLFIGCVGFVLLPTAPPWMAGGGHGSIRLDAIAPVARPVGHFWQQLGLVVLTDTWDSGRQWLNEVAAMPSLHAAFSLLVVVFFLPRVRRWWLRAALLSFPLAMALSVVYLGEHYVVDVLTGWATVAVAFAIWNRIERRADVADADLGDSEETERHGTLVEAAQ